MTALYTDFQYSQERPTTQRGGVTSIGFETQAGPQANAPIAWPVTWLEPAVAVGQSLRRVIVQSDGKVWAGFRTARSPNAYARMHVVLSFTLDDLEFRAEGVPAFVEGQLPDNTTAADINVLTGLRLAVQGRWRWVRLPGTAPAMYAEAARRKAAGEGIDLRGTLDLPGWQRQRYGHWYAKFTAGGDRLIECTAHGAATVAAGTITQAFDDAKAPLLWAREAGMAPTIDSVAIAAGTGLVTLTLSGGELRQSVLNNQQIDLRVTVDGEVRLVEMEGPRLLRAPTSPYVWLPGDPSTSAGTASIRPDEIVNALQGFNPGRGDHIDMTIRPGPVFRVWSGEGDREFEGEVYEGALMRSGETFMEISPVEYTIGRPGTRAQVRLGMTFSGARRLLQQHLGDIHADVKWCRSDDGINYRYIGRRAVGWVSGHGYDPDDGALGGDIETWLTDGDLPPEKWSFEAQQERHPGDLGFEYTSELARQNLTYDWPRIQ